MISSDFLEGLVIIEVSEDKKNKFKNFKRLFKIFNRAFTIKIVTDNKINLKEILLLRSRFYRVKKSDGLIEAFIKTFINIRIFIIKGFRIYKYDIMFSILDYF